MGSSARLSSEAAKKYGTKLYDLAARLCTMGDSQQISLCLNRGRFRPSADGSKLKFSPRPSLGYRDSRPSL